MAERAGKVAYAKTRSIAKVIKVRERILHIGLIAKVILKLFSDIGISSSADITRALLGCVRGGSVYVASFRFKAKETLQRCGDVFFDILIISKGASALVCSHKQ